MMQLAMRIMSLAAAVAAAAAAIDIEPETYAQMARMVEEANAPHAASSQHHVGPTASPPPPPSPAWTKFEQQYSALKNSTCATVLSAAPTIPAADVASFMSVYTAWNGTYSEDPVFEAALKILHSSPVDAYLGAADSFQPGCVCHPTCLLPVRLLAIHFEVLLLDNLNG